MSTLGTFTLSLSAPIGLTLRWEIGWRGKPFNSNRRFFLLRHFLTIRRPMLSSVATSIIPAFAFNWLFISHFNFLPFQFHFPLISLSAPFTFTLLIDPHRLFTFNLPAFHFQFPLTLFSPSPPHFACSCFPFDWGACLLLWSSWSSSRNTNGYCSHIVKQNIFTWPVIRLPVSSFIFNQGFNSAF